MLRHWDQQKPPTFQLTVGYEMSKYQNAPEDALIRDSFAWNLAAMYSKYTYV